jgi:hypothetical protein
MIADFEHHVALVNRSSPGIGNALLSIALCCCTLEASRTPRMSAGLSRCDDMPIQQDYKLALQTFQSQRLQRDLADLAAEAQYRQIAQFFFEEMYGPRDFNARDEQAQRAHWFVHRMPGLTVHDIEPVLELLELTNRLDDQIAGLLIELGAPLDFDEAIYERAYRQADNYAARVRQIDLAIVALGNVYRLGRRRLLGVVLQSTYALAHAVGMGDLHRFLRLGFQAIQPVRDIRRFLNTIETREKARLDRIYMM